jgi:hypothetical protein
MLRLYHDCPELREAANGRFGTALADAVPAPPSARMVCMCGIVGVDAPPN